jgi:Putative metal-binding motif/FG-GAP-like repeat
MNKLGLITAMLFLVVLISYTGSTRALAQTEYIDPVVGDDHNPGLSSVTAKRSNEYVISEQAQEIPRNLNLGTRHAAAIEIFEDVDSSYQSEPEWQRIILGTKTITGWNAFAPTIWWAPLYLTPDHFLQGVEVDGIFFQRGCTPDFMSEMQFSWAAGILYINYPEGNPDVAGKTIIAYIYDDQTQNYLQETIFDWSAASPTVWQAGMIFEPLHVFVNNQLYDGYQKWWWGPLYCEEQTGDDGFLYLRDSDGNPDTMAKKIEAVVETGGWGVTSGDFNGDGLSDVVHSNHGSQIFINYGALEFNASSVQVLISPEGQAVFGFFVASAGDVNNDGYDELLVSMDWGEDKVYLFMGSESGLSDTPSIQLSPPSEITSYGFGHSIAGNGDINGDNFSDILIMGGDNTESYLCVYLGSAEGIPSLPNLTIQFQDKVYGGSICLPGDMNGDGFDEVAVSMKDIEIPTNRIEVYVFNGSQAANLSNPKILEFVIPETTTHVCADIAPAGDINADGYADLIVGNQWTQTDHIDIVREGKAYIFLGSETGPPSIPDQEIESPIPGINIRFGKSVSGIGDIDHNGYDDIAVGCPYGQDGLGFLAIYSGSATGINYSPIKIITGVNYFGWSISGVGDLNGLDQTFLLVGEEFGGAYLYALPCDTLFYVDKDGDGYGDANSNPSCIQHTGYVADNTDCNDDNANIHPGVTEICNNMDDDCDGSIDKGVTNTYYRDSDGDTYGDQSDSTESCSPPSGYVADNTDCDDSDGNIHTGANEICGDGIDQDCNGSDLVCPGDDDAVDITPDSTQDNVESIQSYGNQDEIALESPAGTTLTNCQAIDNPSPEDTPVNIDFPYGLFSFTINDVTPGGSTTMTITLPAGADPTTYYKYGPTPANPSDHWYEFLYDGETGAEINGNIITLHFVDGKRGDSDLDTNGTIVDPGGPSIVDTSDGGGGCFIENVTR